MNIIAAIDQNNGIGYNGKLLEPIGADLTRFRNITMGNIVVMGRKTFESLPNKEPLKGRFNIVISSPDSSFEIGDVSYENLCIVESKEELLAELKSWKSDSIFVIGGGQIYNMLIDYCDKLYITRIHNSYISDTKFPEISKDEWRLIDNTGTFINVETGTEYSFWNYERIGEVLKLGE